MSDSFEDRLRKAAGIPTEGEKQEAIRQQAAREAAWKAGEPAREALKAQFAELVGKFLDQSRIVAAKTAGVGGLVFNEMPKIQNTEHGLLHRTFMLINQDQRNSSSSSLDVVMLHGGKVRVQLNSGSTSVFDNVFDMQVITDQHVEHWFTKLFSTIQRN